MFDVLPSEWKAIESENLLLILYTLNEFNMFYKNKLNLGLSVLNMIWVYVYVENNVNLDQNIPRCATKSKKIFWKMS